ncbi:High-affinity branched-chain amino acid transport system permease protein LivH [Paraburkholderia caffeinitolerans]|uniref:High-affinity branched-chain amino acid transport system permease protein LivH n=1 Tax=Paraburkholderia caffeinitolerans TaxID=1723730 RepID=A0A6J5GIE2_9BURK|nr:MULTISPECIES: branched-chain amino acid ABC transporter permease [Paraburkholderia]CAB3799406.1 High-affinity branched-chain amino acid transport system permease protein LivH [Paraburkholderia caffeinitolerans]
MQAFLIDMLNGASYGLLLFMLSAGLTLIFSMLGVLNFAHASFYMLGAYLGVTLGATLGFGWALVLAPLAAGLAGAAFECTLLRRAHSANPGTTHTAGNPLNALLLTFGAALAIGELVKLVWGLQPLAVSVPAWLDGALFRFGGAAFSRYRAFAMLVAIAMLGAIHAALRVSRTGLVVRAALTHREAVEALGHNVPRVQTMVFALGTALAALAGVVAAPLFVVEPAMAESMGSIVFVVVVTGGLGSLSGAFVAALAVGLLQTFAVSSDVSLGGVAAQFGVTLAPAWRALTLAQIAPLLPYLLLVAMLAVRPQGLFGQRGQRGGDA